ncbi:unnamed protein product [Bursaphelenchus xylophilus]|uniref:(pine wood nematode) hypothetical protein n=1 Tax=Bursaphelenchus xylophilus TaxID=6326 RepID=A0A1I7RIC4_BURXY|nr:unnamed protein product [Bursaphelenchus xylophilus]CAG9114992.1 unnamed protein product [Bursaphelenchus xylophilus]
MNSAVFALFLAGLVAVEACSSAGSSSTTTTTAAAGRKRRHADAAEVILHSKVPVAQSQQLIQKLKNTAASLNLDAERFGKVEQEVGSDESGNAQIYHTLDGNVDCAELRLITKKVLSQVDEVPKASITCQGQKFRV